MQGTNDHKEMFRILGQCLSSAASLIYENNLRLGWRGPKDKKTFGEEIALIHSEASEMLEAYRDYGKERMFTTARGHTFPAEDMPYYMEDDERVPMKPEGIGSEAADIVIRLLDTCYVHGINLGAEIEAKMKFNESRVYRHGGKLL